MGDLVERARDLAHRAHAGQVDKAGRPYIEHVARVAAAVRDYCLLSSDPAFAFRSDEAEAVAWLHDVLEDCGPEYAEEFWNGFPSEVTAAAEKVSRWPGQSSAIYYERIRRNPIALLVKLADIADNADEARLALLDEATAARLRRKYAKALKALVPEEPQP